MDVNPLVSIVIGALLFQALFLSKFKSDNFLLDSGVL